MRCLAPKRHQHKHLDLDLFTFRDQGVGGSNPLSPTNTFIINILALILTLKIPPRA